MMSASNSSTLTEEEAVAAHLLAETDPAALGQKQVDLLYHEDLICAKTLLLSIIEGKNSDATDEKLGVMKLLSDALKVMEAADFNNDAQDIEFRTRHQARRQRQEAMHRALRGEDSDEDNKRDQKGKKATEIQLNFILTSLVSS